MCYNPYVFKSIFTSRKEKLGSYLSHSTLSGLSIGEIGQGRASSIQRARPLFSWETASQRQVIFNEDNSACHSISPSFGPVSPDHNHRCRIEFTVLEEETTPLLL